MKKTPVSLNLALALSLAGMGMATATAATPTATTTANLPATTITANSSEIAKAGYSFGYMMAEGNKEAVSDLDLAAFFQGFKDSYQKAKPALTPQQMQKTLLAYSQRREAEYAKQLQATARKNLEVGEVFLAKNKQKRGVITTASGLQYEVLKTGTGKMPKASDTVKVHYEGKLLDGKIFDSSYKRGEPVTFPLKQVIKGWTEGLPLMKEGAKYRFFIPAKLAYGEAGAPEIEPNSVLLFDVELLEVNPPTKK